jgi:hypothetical protein
MPGTQAQATFSTEEAQRFAALMAGFDTGNPSEAEAIGKVRVLRRMLVEKGLRLVDALELPEIRQALDDQMQPARQAVADTAALQAELDALHVEFDGYICASQAELDDLRGKLAFAMPKLAEVTERLTNERQEFVTSAMWSVGIFMVSVGADALWGIWAMAATWLLGLFIQVVFG